MDTVEEARAKRAKLDSLVHYSNAIGSLSIALGHDASKFDPDGPLPDIPESNASKSGRQRAIDLAKRENLTVRHDAIGIGVNFDRTSNRAGGYRVLVVVEAHQAGLRYRRLYRVEAIEPARIRN